MLKRFPMTKLRLLTLAIIASLVLQAPTYYFPLIFKNGPAPLFSTSYYIQDGDPAKLYDLGYLLGTRDMTTPGRQDSLVILDFAQMWIENGVYGVLGFQYPSGVWRFRSIAQLKESVKGFAQGYWVGSGSDKVSHLTLGIGTSSFGLFNLPNEDQQTIAGDFGRNWAKMVNELNSCATGEPYCSQVFFTGAIDIEWAGTKNSEGKYLWQSPTVVYGWVNEFDKWDMDTAIYFNYGACVGCPASPDQNWIYTAGLPWSQEHVWNVSWGRQPAYALPEIYCDNCWPTNNPIYGLADQWAAVSKAGSLYWGSRIIFTGAMTQLQACQQRGGSECLVLDNTPAEGWGQLVDKVNADIYTEQPLPQFSTDIRWQFK